MTAYTPNLTNTKTVGGKAERIGCLESIKAKNLKVSHRCINKQLVETNVQIAKNPSPVVQNLTSPSLKSKNPKKLNMT